MNVLYADYSSAKTLAALELIEDFIERHGIDDYPFAFLALRKQGSEEGRSIDRSRRHLTQWFSRVQYFYEGGYLQFDALRKFPGAQRAKHFLDLVEPLEFVSRKTTGRKHAGVFDFLRSLYHLKKHSLSPAFVEKVNTLLEGSARRRGAPERASPQPEKRAGEESGPPDGAETKEVGDSLPPPERRFNANPMESVGAEGEEEEVDDDSDEGGKTEERDGNAEEKDAEGGKTEEVKAGEADLSEKRKSGDAEDTKPTRRASEKSEKAEEPEEAEAERRKDRGEEL